MGSLFVEEVDASTTMAICSAIAFESEWVGGKSALRYGFKAIAPRQWVSYDQYVGLSSNLDNIFGIVFK